MRYLLSVVLFCLPALSQTIHGAADLDRTIEQAIKEDKIPGAVLLIGHNGNVVYRKAYGRRALVPSPEPMTVDTIFDLASLTKVVATTSCVMKLFEEGKIWLDDPVTSYLPEFQGGKSAITVRDLMTHFSGLRPDLDLDPPWSGYETGIRRALNDKPANPPETKFVYSDINFILMGEIVRRLSGIPENEYVKKILFEPLRMNDTGYLPDPALKPRIAPTEMLKDGTLLRGVVHDPTTRYMGGVAGQAGVFSTADDLSKFCQMLLDGGDGLFSPVTIRKFTTPETPIGQPILRGLGWDIDSPYSGNRGELFPASSSFGHTGFTGTSIWIDPSSQTYVILLANSGHPQLRKPITPLRREVATIAAASVGYEPDASTQAGATETGLDVLAASHFGVFRGRKVGLITNQSGIDRMGRRNVDLMRQAGVNVVAVFSPEHGFAGAEDHENITDTKDPATGITVFSLYGKTRRPTPEMLRGIDTLVFDIQDLGVRFYTYETTMLYAMEAAAQAKIAFYVLDRPNPLTGLHVEGPMLDPDKLSFVGGYPLPLRHGMTIGELAKLENGERHLGTDLHVIEMSGWRREYWFDATGLTWINPSPNIRNPNEALLYPGIGMLEYSTNYSVGRGTDYPFERVGADWMKGRDLAAYLAGRQLPGVRVYPLKFTPAASNFTGKEIEGVGFEVTDRATFSSARLGLEVAMGLRRLYPGKIAWNVNKSLIGNGGVIAALDAATDPTIPARSGMAQFERIRQNYLLYR
ncbi:MAG TPA: exo-beta-N-acetylmuramidase NamZ domain-containing protein [Bryobacteraceae bacterium]|nr:exo-beta-N-acetylmuramidase NamZ domain-containing protein [Bryobacteraceae bacterium]